MAGGLPEPGTFAARFWTEHHCIAEQALQTSFVQALVDGSLPSEDFDQYIAEDVYFLDVFAHGLSMAIKEARGYNLPVTDMLTDLHSGIAEELKLHNSYQEQSSGRGECKTRHRATTNYTDFLTQIVKTENVACIVASMTPCFRLYAYIGSRLAAQNSGHTHAYSQWIKTYSGEDFQAQAAKMEDLLNLLAPANDQAKLSALYKKALLLEKEFFDAHSPATVL